MVSRGTGFEKSSYSLQYVQERLQRRIGIMCAMIGWLVLAVPLARSFNSRILRLSFRFRRVSDMQGLDLHPIKTQTRALQRQGISEVRQFRVEAGKWRVEGECLIPRHRQRG